MKLKKLLMITASTLMVFSFALTSVFAASHDVATAEEMVEAMNDTDADVVINLTGDIDLVGQLLQGKEGTTYTINGRQYVLKNVVITNLGNFTLNGKVNNINTHGSTTTTVNGDVDGSVETALQSQLEVNGNITGGVLSDGASSVTVNGDINAVDSSGVATYGDAKVEVNGNVTGADGAQDGSYDGSAAVVAQSSSTIKVNGDVTGGDAYGPACWAGNGAVATGDANVTINGNATGGNLKGTSVGAEAADRGKAGSGLEIGIGGNANVTITGNATGGNSEIDKIAAGAGISIILNEEDGGIVDGASAKIVVAGEVKGGNGAVGGNGVLADFGIGPSDLDNWDIVYSLLIEAEKSNNPIDQEFYQDARAAMCSVLDISTDEFDKLLVGGGLFDLLFDLDEATDKQLLDNVIGLAKVALDKEFAEMLNITTWGVSGGNEADEFAAGFAKVLEPTTNYIVRIKDSANGTISVDKPTAKAGEVVTVTPTPKDGYQVSKIYLGDQEIKPVDGKYAFTMPNYGYVEISGEFSAKAIEPTKTNTPAKTAKSVKTGDDMMIGNYVLVILSSFAIAAVLKKKRA